jgi:putative endonuclease
MYCSKSYFVYITCNQPRGVLYVGMTSDLPGRAWEHHHRIVEGFTRKYWADRVVYFEEHDDAASAAHRERAMKRWRRDWKIRLVEAANPTWRDLYQNIIAAAGYES